MQHSYVFKGGSGISPTLGEGGGEAPTYDFAKFSKKTPWNWENYGPPTSATGIENTFFPSTGSGS